MVTVPCTILKIAGNGFNALLSSEGEPVWACIMLQQHKAAIGGAKRDYTMLLGIWKEIVKIACSQLSNAFTILTY